MANARAWVLGFPLCFVLAAGTRSSTAQTTGELRGAVTGSNGAGLAGVTVEARSPSLQGVRSTSSDASGRFQLALLPPGIYGVEARLPGFRTESRPGVRVALGETAVVPFTLVVETAAGVEVTAHLPLVDTVHTQTGTSLPASTLTRLPLGRNFTSAMLTVGGTGTDSQGNTVYGATGLENNYIVDGLNTTGVLQGAQGKQLNLEFVQEVEVRTGGYEAEFGRALGGSVNVITKSGGNEFHGDLFGYYDSASLTSADKHVEDREAANLALVEPPTRYDFGLDLGGYAVKDTLWFFGAYDRVASDADYRRVESLTYTPTSVVSNYVDGTDVTRTDLFSAKLTLRAGPSHTFVASVFGDPTTFDGRQATNIRGPDSAVLAKHETGGTDVVARWEGIFGSKLLAQAQYGYHGEAERYSSDYADRLTVMDFRRGLGQFAPGSGPGNLYPSTLRRNAWSASATAFLGSHELKGGVGYEYLNSTWPEYLPGGGWIIRWRGSATGAFLYAAHFAFARIPLNCQVRTDGSRGSFGFVDPTTCNGWEPTDRAEANPTTRNLAFFLQDSWKPLPNLTVNVGLRYEDQRLYDAGGQPRIKLTDQVSPRVGVVWDPLADGRSKAWAFYGRFYQVIPQSIQVSALGNQYSIFAYNYSENELDLVNDSELAPFEYLYGSDYVPPGVKGLYQDEIAAGVEAEVWSGWSVGIKGIYRALGRVLEDRCDVYDPRSGLAGTVPLEAATGCVVINPGEGDFGQLSDPANPDCWEDYPASTVPRPCESVRASRVFRGLQLDVRRRMSERFQLQASYLYSKLTGNYDGFVNERSTQAWPGLNGDFDYPDTLVNVHGSLSLDRTHQARLSGIYAFRFGLQAGVSAAFATGAPLSVMGSSRSGYPEYLEPRGSWDRLPSTYNVDLHLEYAVRIGAVSLTPVVDVFNLTNVQTATRRGETYNSSRNGNQDPPYTNPTVVTFGKDLAWQSPRVVRLGARVSY